MRRRSRGFRVDGILQARSAMPPEPGQRVKESCPKEPYFDLRRFCPAAYSSTSALIMR